MRGLRPPSEPRRPHASCCSRPSPAIVLSVVMNWPLILHLGETIPKDLGDPLPQSWQIAWGGYALLSPAARLLPVEPVLAAPRHARLLGCAARLRAGRPDRLRPRATRRRATTCCSCSPTRSASSAPTCSRASSGSARRRGDRRRRLRVRAVSARAGRPPARDLERRDPARARRRTARLPPAAGPGSCSRGFAVATWQFTPRPDPRAAALLSAGAAGADRRGLLVAARSPAAAAPAGDRDRRRRGAASGHRGADRAPLPAGRRRAARRGAPAVDGRGVLGLAAGLRRRPGREPDLGRGERADPRQAPEPAGEDALSRSCDPRRWRSPAWSRARCRRGVRIGLGIGVAGTQRALARLLRVRRLAVAGPDRLRALAGVGRASARPGGCSRSRRSGLALLAGAGAVAAWPRCGPGRWRSRRVGGGRRRAACSRSRSRAAALPFDPTDNLAQPRVPPAPG